MAIITRGSALFLRTLLLASVSGASVFATPAAFAQPVEGDDLIVTARKVSENVQDVPISIELITGDRLQREGITRPIDLQFSVPGLVVTPFGAQARFALRGVGDEGGSGLSIATHFNGVYSAVGAVALARAFDIQRVEVLKGPQGTLYGRNATGGSINFITRTATDTLEAFGQISYGSYNTVRGEAMLNLPISEGLSARFAFSGSNGDGFIRNVVDSRKFGEDDFYGVRATLSARYGAFSADVMVQRTEDTGGRQEVWVARPDRLIVPGNPYRASITLPDPFLRTEADMITANASLDLGFASVRTITGYTEASFEQNRDCGAVAPNCVARTLPTDGKAFNQELQLVSPEGGAISWILGAYYYNATDRSQGATSFSGPPPLAALGDTENGERTAAAFGQATWEITDRLSVTGGLRYTWERRYLRDFVRDIENRETWDDVSWRGDVSYKIDPDKMVYASVSRGFKSGGVTSQLLPDGNYDVFDPEVLIAYEAGLKSQWLDRRLTLNLAAFYYDFKDLQVFTSILDPETLLFINSVDNAAAVEIYGLDFQTNYQVSDSFSVSANAGFLPKREFKEFMIDNGADLTGNKVSRAPRWSGSVSAEYRQPILSAGTLSIRGEVQFRSSFFYTKENIAPLTQPKSEFVNLYLRFDSEDERWFVFASGRNLTKQEYFYQAGFQSNPAYPDNYEAGIGFRF